MGIVAGLLDGLFQRLIEGIGFERYSVVVVGCVAATDGVLRHWAACPRREAPAERAAPAREGEKPKPGGIFRLGDAGLPVAPAEGQQDSGIGDPGAVVDEGNAGGIAVLFNRRGNAGSAATA